MFFVDDLLLSPVKGLAAICRHVQQTARQDFKDQQRSIVANLSELHRLIEAGQIGPEEFDTQEASLLERLEKIEELLGALGEGTD